MSSHYLNAFMCEKERTSLDKDVKGRLIDSEHHINKGFGNNLADLQKDDDVQSMARALHHESKQMSLF